MKRIQIIIPVLLGAFCTGCDLDIEPRDRYDQQTFWYSAAAEGGLTESATTPLLPKTASTAAPPSAGEDARPNGYNFSGDISPDLCGGAGQHFERYHRQRWSHATQASDAVMRCWTASSLNREAEQERHRGEYIKSEARASRHAVHHYMLTTYWLITDYDPAMEHSPAAHPAHTKEVVSFVASRTGTANSCLRRPKARTPDVKRPALALKAASCCFRCSPL